MFIMLISLKNVATTKESSKLYYKPLSTQIITLDTSCYLNC